VIRGPALVESDTSTVVIEPGWKLTTGLQGAAVMERDEPEQSSH
jgi:N-methylhydantoinase A/oxoprolinase/acetone carboxylase beta subunit